MHFPINCQNWASLGGGGGGKGGVDGLSQDCLGARRGAREKQASEWCLALPRCGIDKQGEGDGRELIHVPAPHIHQ